MTWGALGSEVRGGPGAETLSPLNSGWMGALEDLGRGEKEATLFLRGPLAVLRITAGSGAELITVAGGPSDQVLPSTCPTAGPRGSGRRRSSTPALRSPLSPGASMQVRLPSSRDHTGQSSQLSTP